MLCIGFSFKMSIYAMLHFTVNIYVSEHGHTSLTCFHCEDIYGDRTCQETISCLKETQVSFITYNVMCNRIIHYCKVCTLVNIYEHEV